MLLKFSGTDVGGGCGRQIEISVGCIIAGRKWSRWGQESCIMEWWWWRYYENGADLCDWQCRCFDRNPELTVNAGQYQPPVALLVH